MYEWFFNLLARDREIGALLRERAEETAATTSRRRAPSPASPGASSAAPDNAIVLFFAAPVQRYKNVDGALLLSTSTHEIARSVRQVRLDILRIIAVVTVFTIFMAFWLARSIARPINRLAAAADAMRRSKSREVSIPDFTEREDESAIYRRRSTTSQRSMAPARSERILRRRMAHELKNRSPR